MAKSEFEEKEKENKRVEKERKKEMKRREKEEEKAFRDTVKKSAKQKGKKGKVKSNNDGYKYGILTRILAFLLLAAMLFSVFATLISYLIIG